VPLQDVQEGVQVEETLLLGGDEEALDGGGGRGAEPMPQRRRDASAPSRVRRPGRPPTSTPRASTPSGW
jgi:hypothetical protein